MTDRTCLLRNADVRCMDEAGTRAGAVAWREGALLAVGTEAEVARTAGPGAETFDAAGATVLPGFIDAHHHPCLAMLYGGLPELRPPRVTDIASLQEALATASAELEPGRWLVAVGWDELLLAERRAPRRSELDDAVPDRPLFAIHYTHHRGVANARALELAGIDKRTPDPSGGFIERDRSGSPNGLLVERGMSRVEALARASMLRHDTEGYLERLARHHRALIAAGITRVVDACVPGDLVALYREAARRELLLVPTRMMRVSTAGHLEPPWDVLEGPTTGQSTGEEEGEATDLLEVGPLKLVFDGAPGCAMCLSVWQVLAGLIRTWATAIRAGSLDPVRAAMSLGPRLGADLSVRSGIAIYRPEEADAIVCAAAERGFAVGTHAIGNEAIGVALSAYEAAGPALHRRGVPRIEHGWFLDRALVSRIADVGAAVVAQPAMITLPAFANAPAVPGLRNLPLRWLLDAGVQVAGSSDYPVTGLDPLDGIRSAVHRRTAHGHPLEPDQALDLDEALRMYTRTAAEVSGCLDRSGTLEPGKRADLVVLDRPLSNDTLQSARVRATVLGGNLLHGHPAGRSDG